MYEIELAYFKAHQDELVQQYNGKVLVIRGEHIDGAYDTPLDACIAGLAVSPLGTFMIQRCIPGPAAYTVTISTVGLVA